MSTLLCTIISAINLSLKFLKTLFCNHHLGKNKKSVISNTINKKKSMFIKKLLMSDNDPTHTPKMQLRRAICSMHLCYKQKQTY